MSCNFISTNQELRTGEYIKSVNNEYYAILQVSTTRVVWQSGTTAEPPSSRMRLTITNQGSLLLDNDGDAIWSSACSAKDKTK
uniref:Bulb-type lectin domain-containing protein n=1 Tax=Periophthalmus magnuspinnatus TaxID=409849 RepID=A0A3B4B034_9GOBI